MLVVYGFYRFGDRRNGYRNDYCLRCGRESYAERFSSFNVGHLFFIPILPLGRHERWRCHACWNNPHARVKSSKVILGLGAIVMAVFLVMTAFVSNEDAKGDVAMLWGVRLGLAAAIAALVVMIRRDSGDDLGLKERLKTILPFAPQNCIYCRGWLDSNGFCPACQVQRCVV